MSILINRLLQDVANELLGIQLRLCRHMELSTGSLPIFVGFICRAGKVAQILVDMMDPQAVGFYGMKQFIIFIGGGCLPEEWNALLKASKKYNWRERYGIVNMVRWGWMT